MTNNLDDDVASLEPEDNGTASTAATSTSRNKQRPNKSATMKKKKSRKNILHLYEQNAPTSDAKSKHIIEQLKELYKTKVLPVERNFFLTDFALPTDGEIQDAEFEAKPMVLLLGPYSTGKTSFIRHLLGGKDFPGCHIGPEPTTDKFMALVHGEVDDSAASDRFGGMDSGYLSSDDDREDTDLKMGGKIVKGNTLTVTPELPFAGLSRFGGSFLDHFNGSVSPAPLLGEITLIDTPGVLSGEKQRLARDYNFAEVTQWFADRSDLILMLFDAHKLDISDELKEVVERIHGSNDDKVRCVLNKADGVNREQLVRVYGSLMWSMGKLFKSPEVPRIYTGSYWDQPFQHEDFSHMFETDEMLLVKELLNLPVVSAERKVNNMVKRIRIIKTHVCILGYLKQQMPRFYGHALVRQRLIENLDEVFERVRKIYNLPRGDLPDLEKFKTALQSFDNFSVFPSAQPALLRQLDELVSQDIPDMMKGQGGVSAGEVKPKSKSRGLAKHKGRSLASVLLGSPDYDTLEIKKHYTGFVVLRAVKLLILVLLVTSLVAYVLLVYVPPLLSQYGYEQPLLLDRVNNVTEQAIKSVKNMTNMTTTEVVGKRR